MTGTRADYGKLKSLIREASKYFETHIFVCGMHLLEKHGNTYQEIYRDGFSNICCAENLCPTGQMDIDLAQTIIRLNQYVNDTKPDLLVVHGDRVDAMAGAISGMLNNIPVAHIEGGEVTGTVDEAIRHSISKMAHLHFVANYESKLRLMQLGEQESNIYVIGSPDIDIMLSIESDIQEIKARYQIPFEKYAILIYHPVTTEVNSIRENVEQLLMATNSSGLNYIIIYPNNDLGSDIIISKIKELEGNQRYKTFKSVVFEDFLCLLKNADFIIGNSSAGVREACVYGVPAIDIGSRQLGRYKKESIKNIQHCYESSQDIASCIKRVNEFRISSRYFGDGNSANQFACILTSLKEVAVQKRFVDIDQTQKAIENYINEVCF